MEMKNYLMTELVVSTCVAAEAEPVGEVVPKSGLEGNFGLVGSARSGGRVEMDTHRGENIDLDRPISFRITICSCSVNAHSVECVFALRLPDLVGFHFEVSAGHQ
ncbi:hypothetical protein BD410DRAFT_399595 [Rickenella mellea]|uniref:Uncharacterized protein n=1 Tax=Rickenella mellea TaxID=50990 RepID=A0A4Y7PW76_9AGAM|nr:hypothetical protein BD410DRAFT_399595 [Rickenella mellea]